MQASTNMTILMSAILTLTALLPLAPSYIAHHLPDLFEVFSRLAAWRSGNNPTGDDNTLTILCFTPVNLFCDEMPCRVDFRQVVDLLNDNVLCTIHC